MAMEVWAASPRLSFSNDLSQSDLAPSTTDVRRVDGSLPLEPPSTDFDFSISYEISIEDASPAGEIFSDGKILPLSVKKPVTAPSSPTSSSPNPPNRPSPILDKKGSLKEMIANTDYEEVKRAIGRRSFWRFGRSSSVGDSRPKARLICPFSLSRSKSTGSYPTPNSNRRNRNYSNANPVPIRQASIDPNPKSRYYYPVSKGGGYGNGVRISPVLNVPAPSIPRGGSSGSSNGNGGRSSNGVFAYLLCNCVDKSMKESEVSWSP